MVAKVTDPNLVSIISLPCSERNAITSTASVEKRECYVVASTWSMRAPSLAGSDKQGRYSRDQSCSNMLPVTNINWESINHARPQEPLVLVNYTDMHALHLLVTTVLSLFTTAYDDARRGVAPGTAVDGLGISNRDLAVVSTSNTSDANSLNRNSKRALGDPRLAVRREDSMETIPLTVSKGRFTGPVTFGIQPVARVLFDTGSSMTWVHSISSAPEAPPFSSMGFYKLKGHIAKGPVTVNELPVSEMDFRMVPDDTLLNGYEGGLTLDRSIMSWPTHLRDRRPIFAFHSLSPTHAEFHLGGFLPSLARRIEWHRVNSHNKIWTLENAHIKVNGEGVQVEGISTAMDTGVRYIYGSASEVAKVYQRLKGARFLDRHWRVPCDEQPQVSFSWGKADLPIHDFFAGALRSVVGGTEYCSGMIRPHGRLPANTFVLGTGFFYGKCTAFGKGAMGFVVL